MSLRLLRFDPDPQRAGTWMAAERLAVRGVSEADDGYGWHALLAAAFGEAAPKPFRVVARPGRAPQLLAYGVTPLSDLRLHAGDFADPLVVAALRLSAAEEKPMPSFATGRRLGFEVRLRPTLRRDRAGDRDRSAEIDVYIAARDAAPPGEPPDRAAVYAAWLADRLGAAARMESARVLELRRHRLVRRDRARDLRTVEGHSVSFAGTLRVTDEAAFAGLLARGVGRHRAFGFGMLLLRPPEA